MMADSAHRGAGVMKWGQALDPARAQSTIEAFKENVAILEGTVTKAEARAERAEERLALVAQGAAGTAPRRP